MIMFLFLKVPNLKIKKILIFAEKNGCQKNDDIWFNSVGYCHLLSGARPGKVYTANPYIMQLKILVHTKHLKKLSHCYKFKFSNLYIFAT